MLPLPPKPAQAVPLHIIAGLHGSGKTSFLQHQLDHVWSGEKLGLILCEEGSAKLDLSHSRVHTERLLNACVCCEMAYSFFEVVLRLLRDHAVQRIIVELPAQADVQQIFGFIRSSHLGDYLSFEPIHVLVDLRNPHMKRSSPAPLIRRLMEQAEVFVLNYHDSETKRPFDAAGKPCILHPGIKRMEKPQFCEG